MRFGFHFWFGWLRPGGALIPVTVLLTESGEPLLTEDGTLLTYV